jgi:hypothetical protein
MMTSGRWLGCSFHFRNVSDILRLSIINNMDFWVQKYIFPTTFATFTVIFPTTFGYFNAFFLTKLRLFEITGFFDSFSLNGGISINSLYLGQIFGDFCINKFSREFLLFDDSLHPVG